jgi:hypothetical protein
MALSRTVAFYAHRQSVNRGDPLLYKFLIVFMSLTVHVPTVSMFSDKGTSRKIYTRITRTQTPACFGILLPSSGSYCNKGIGANLLIYVLLIV